jgi:hypothetical protein
LLEIETYLWLNSSWEQAQIVRKVLLHNFSSA